MAFSTSRWTFSNILPVAFLTFVVGFLESIYVVDHLVVLVSHQQTAVRGWIQLVISQVLVLMVILNMLLAMFTNPGSVPDTEPWLRGVAESSIPDETVVNDKKHDGRRRFCKWCNKYKPDRCHHCRMCRSCILRMDHHCPWIANCVGFFNHKYFFLFVMYSTMLALMVVISMSESAFRVVNEEATPSERFKVISGMTLASLMMVLLICFFGCHFSLMMQATTTIEYCEKRSQKGAPTEWKYDNGHYENIKAVLGPTPLLWFLPVSCPTGDGFSFRQPVKPTATNASLTVDSKKPPSASMAPSASSGGHDKAATGSSPLLESDAYADLGDDEAVEAEEVHDISSTKAPAKDDAK